MKELLKITKDDLRKGYVIWGYYENLQDWAEAEFISLKQLRKVYPLELYAVYDYHKLLTSREKVLIKDIPIKVLQAFDNKTSLLKRKAGLMSGFEKDFKYIKYGECSPNLELLKYGKTFTKFFDVPEGACVDIPLPFTKLRAHYCKDYNYVIYLKKTDFKWQRWFSFYKKMVEDFILVTIKEIK